MDVLNFILIALALFGYENGFSYDDMALLNANGIGYDLARNLEPVSQEVQQLFTIDDQYRHAITTGVVLKVSPGSGADVVETLREQLRESRQQSYLYEDNFGYEQDKVAIVPSKDDLVYLQKVRTDGINYDLTADEVLEQYSEWRSMYELELLGAGRDWLEAKILENDVNWLEFAESVYAFCPDVVDQGTDTVQALAESMRDTQTLYCWWD